MDVILYQYLILLHNHYDAQFVTLEDNPTESQILAWESARWQVKIVDLVNLSLVYKSEDYDSISLPRLNGTNEVLSPYLVLINRLYLSDENYALIGEEVSPEDIRTHVDEIKLRLSLGESWSEIALDMSINYRMIWLATNANKELRFNVPVPWYYCATSLDDLKSESFQDGSKVVSADVFDIINVVSRSLPNNNYSPSFENLGWRATPTSNNLLNKPTIQPAEPNDLNHLAVNFAVTAGSLDNVYDIEIINPAGWVIPSRFWLDGTGTSQLVEFDVPVNEAKLEVSGLSETKIGIHVFGERTYRTSKMYMVNLQGVTQERLPDYGGYLHHGDIVIVRGKTIFTLEQSRSKGQFSFLLPY